MSERFYRRASAIFLPALALLLTCGQPVSAQSAGAQSPAAQKRQSDAATQDKPWSVKVSKGTPRTFAVKAKEAKLPEIAAELSRLLKIPVHVSPLMAKQVVTNEFSGMNVEATVRMLAPQVFIDYVEGGDAEPKPLAIYLQAYNESPPSANAAVRGDSEAMLIEGNTEDGVDDQSKKEAEDPLRVTFVNNQLSVRAHKQPLSVVLYKIANEVGVPFELRNESPETVDVEFENYTLEQALRSLSPQARLYYRLDLQTMQPQPLRVVLVSPTAPKS